MPAAVLVVYDGTPEDPETFYRYYIERHLPLVWEFPRIRGIEIDRCAFQHSGIRSLEFT